MIFNLRALTSGRRCLSNHVGAEPLPSVGNRGHPELVLPVRLQVLDGDPPHVRGSGVLVVASIDHVRVNASGKRKVTTS